MTKSLVIATALIAASVGGAFAQDLSQEAGTINVWGARLNPAYSQSPFGPARVTEAPRSVEVTGSTDIRPAAAKRAPRAR